MASSGKVGASERPSRAPTPTDKNFQEKEPNKPGCRVASLASNSAIRTEELNVPLSMEAAKSNTELEENRHWSDQVG
ncbi:hypothetical protein CEXT_647361 [Caerostris extrusa]|uniref:Uncharacterized protein n=1 Tax=Caerostris extrusa TaxID=172846 RepID=A0AAV4QA66_CAEEX|nr:hypothetical protein CEXT_647361 [Caerostris extrusa]